MKIVIDIPDEQIEKSLAESKYIHENEGEKGSVNIVLLYTNKKLEFVDISRKTDFYSLTDKYTVLPKGHGDLKKYREETTERYKPIILQEHDAEPRTMRAILDTATDEIYICKLTRQGAEILGMTIEEVND